MSYLEDFNKLNPSVKSVVIGIVLIIPFWYFDIYLFKKKFFYDAPIFIPIVASFCLSVVSLLLFVIAIILENYTDPKNTEREYSPEKIMNTSVIISVVWLSVMSYSQYVGNKIFSSLLNEFLYLPCSIIVMCIIVLLINWGKSFRKKK